MANFSGTSQQSASELITFDQSKATGRFAFYTGVADDFDRLSPLGAGDHTAVGSGHPAAPAEDNYSGLEAIWETQGFDWFNKIHLLPKAKIQFGNIVTSATAEYELFNAWKTTVTMTSVGNNLGAGSSLPELPAVPADLAPFTSFTASSSTRLSYDKLTLAVDADGAPTFDDSVVFSFDTGETPQLLASGTRISMITPIYEQNVQERWSFMTDMIEAISGKEQRVGLRSNPRQEIVANYLLDETERQRMQVLLHGWQTKLFAVPIWHEQRRATAAAAVSATSVQVNDTTDFDFRVGGLAVIFESATKFDVLIVSAVASNQIDFTSSPLLNSYSAGAVVMPVRTAWIRKIVRGGRFRNNLENFQIDFAVSDNDTGMFTSSTTGWTTSSVDGTSRIVLDDCNVMNTPQMAEQFRQKITVVDNKTGNIEVTSRWDNNKRASQKGFGMHSQSEIMKTKRLLLHFNGKQKAWWLPSRISDLTPEVDLVSGENLMTISHIGYTRFAGSTNPKNPKQTFRINFTDGTYLERQVTASTELSSTQERLTLSGTWPANRTLAEIDFVEWMELSRFDSDVFIFQFPRVGYARMTAPVVTVFD